jgi:hypothetical protein
MLFEKFLTSMQAMFAGFEDSCKHLTDNQNVRLLFQKVQSPSLTQVRSTLIVQSDFLEVAGTTVSYDFVANSLSVEAASLSDHVPNPAICGRGSRKNRQ